MFASKWLILILTWAAALLLSFGLRYWGLQHPEPFTASFYLLFALLFAPSLLIGLWLVFFGFQKVEVK